MCQIAFRNSCLLPPSNQEFMGVPVCFHHHSHLALSSFLVFDRVIQCKVIPVIISILTSLITNDFEHLQMFVSLWVFTHMHAFIFLIYMHIFISNV